MSNSSWLVPAAAAVFTPIIMSAFGKRSAVSVTADAYGMRTLRLPKAFGIFGWVAMVMALGFLYGAVGVALKGDLLALFLFLISAAFIAMALSLVLGGHNHTVTFDSARLIVTDARKRTETCGWGEIVSGRVHPLSKMIVLRTTDGRRLRINPYLIGSDDLFRMMADRTTLPVQDIVTKARTHG